MVGGSYKGFYLNQINKIKHVDLIIFQKGIIYDFDYEEEYCGSKVVGGELVALNKKFGCPIVVFGNSVFLGNKEKCFIVCINGKVSVIPIYRDVYLYLHGKLILISNKINAINMSNKYFSLILMLDKKMKVNFNKMAKNLFVCDGRGVVRVQEGIFYKKFRKYCYFSLCFHKKMI